MPVSLLVNMAGIKKDQEAGFQTLPMEWVQRDRQTARLYAQIAKSEPNKSHKATPGWTPTPRIDQRNITFFR